MVDVRRERLIGRQAFLLHAHACSLGGCRPDLDPLPAMDRHRPVLSIDAE